MLFVLQNPLLLLNVQDVKCSNERKKGKRENQGPFHDDVEGAFITLKLLTKIIKSVSNH